MARHDGTPNLIPLTKRTKEEQREITRRAGKKSGEARRKKRDMKNEMRAVLDMLLPAKGKAGNYDKIREALQKIGIPDDEMTMRRAIVVNVAQMSLTPKGEKWAKLAAELSGEMPESRVSVEADIAEAPQVHIFIPDNGRDGLADGGAEK